MNLLSIFQNKGKPKDKEKPIDTSILLNNRGPIGYAFNTQNGTDADIARIMQDKKINYNEKVAILNNHTIKTIDGFRTILESTHDPLLANSLVEKIGFPITMQEILEFLEYKTEPFSRNPNADAFWKNNLISKSDIDSLNKMDLITMISKISHYLSNDVLDFIIYKKIKNINPQEYIQLLNDGIGHVMQYRLIPIIKNQDLFEDKGSNLINIMNCDTIDTNSRERILGRIPQDINPTRLLELLVYSNNLTNREMPIIISKIPKIINFKKIKIFFSFNEEKNGLDWARSQIIANIKSIEFNDISDILEMVHIKDEFKYYLMDKINYNNMSIEEIFQSSIAEKFKNYMRVKIKKTLKYNNGDRDDDEGFTRK